MNQKDASTRRRSVPLALGLILAAYLCARILEVVPSSIPRTAIVALDVLSAAAFALTDGLRRYRLRGMLVFVAICLIVGNLSENLSVVTGFPFGHYYFLELMGPKLFHVPVLLGLAYIGMAYVSWMLARIIAGKPDAPITGTRVVALPMIAAFIMTAWDLAQDPVWATVLHGWVWRDGGPWFGVPVSNYLGWYGNVFIIYLFFVIYLSRSERLTAAAFPMSLRPAVLFYALCAAGNVLQIIPHPVPAVVHDPTGRLWRVADILHASALVSIFVMGGFAFLAWLRLKQTEQPAEWNSSESTASANA